MAGVLLCEPTELYNVLNQHRRFPRLAEPNYLSLLDARTLREYNESHIIMARRIEQSPTGEYVVPDSEELACVRYCVVYDCETSSLDFCDYEEEEKEKGTHGSDGSSETEHAESSSSCSQNTEEGTAARHARSLQQFTRHPVLVLRGGYRRFSACYHFLRTQKILWMPQELDSFQPYPVEILPGKLYMGNFKQACDQQIQKDLKIKAQVNISEQPAPLLAEEGKYLHISVPDSLEADLFSSFSAISHFIESLGPRSEMQNKHETAPGLRETAFRLGDPALRDHGHRRLRTQLLSTENGSREGCCFVCPTASPGGRV
ncbi:serine/threonine/tyrosine-interacting-like protein 1 isoform X5 [Numida meleagris]|uniref:serine/threonine/tyrosine-interacting-like protein 1 isoform X5 n=1 Tax=Numida meleagris TaxID=8996 RepID=UPI000B3DE9B0|nr:serine/threonine/tyrosine-interacting-like protein 1 isoform X5 [Numida meleagris]